MWRKWWLLFTVIWVAVAGIQVAVILATSEQTEKAVRPAVVGIAIPAVLFTLGWVWERLRKK